MKLLLFVIGLLCCGALNLIAQTQNDWGPTKAMLHAHELNSLEQVELKIMPGFDLQKLVFEDSINDQNKIGPWRFGHSLEVDFNPSNSGTWENIAGNGRIWRLRIKSDDALSLNLLIEDYKVSDSGGYFAIYSSENERDLLVYTNQNNLDHGKLGTELIHSDEIILELYEPSYNQGQSSITIKSVIHGYRSLDAYAQNMSRALNSSGDCNIDILCPEGNGWEMQSKSVAMIVVNGNGACTGALVNNTQNDGTPYFLTANHCGTDPSNWAFRFNWDSPNPSCATTTPSTDGPTNMQTANGGIFRAANAGSDFFLLEISNPPPASWDIYYAGWDKTDVVPDSVIGIHHPAGDVKKICKYYAAPNQTLFNAGGGGQNAECWEILDWTMGVTEGGSSGSPLFDQNHRVIGQLFGGTAACDNTITTEDNAQPDYYGRFGISWDGPSASERLKDWLDPTGTDTNFIDGYYPLTITDDFDAFAVVVQNLPTDICGENSASPSLYLRNNGLQTLTSLDIKIDIDGSITVVPWTGNLASGAYETIPLGALIFNDGTDISVSVYTESPNGNLDQNPSNDTISTKIDVQSTGEIVSFSIETDCNASETGIYVENSLGMIVETLLLPNTLSDNFFANSINRDVCLSEDCYNLVITDDAGDGWPDNWLCFGTPEVTVDYNGSTVINETTFNFTTELSLAFCTGFASVSELNYQVFTIYPNPTNGIIHFKSADLKEDFKVELLDLSGRLLIALDNPLNIDLSAYSEGTYLIRVKFNGGGILTKKVIRL